MLWFEQEVSKYLVSKFVLKYNIKPWEYFHPFAVDVCFGGLHLVYVEIDGSAPLSLSPEKTKEQKITSVDDNPDYGNYCKLSGMW